MVQVRLLGGQRVDGVSAAGPPSARALELLAYLVVHEGLLVPRSQLAGLLWPDSTENQARTNLRRELHHLRSVIGPDPCLEVQHDGMAWRAQGHCFVDVCAFERESAATVAAGKADDKPGVARHALAALDAYGGPLLPGAYADWVLAARADLARGAVDVCDRGSAALRELGDLGRASDVARRRTVLEPLEEVGYRRLIELHVEAGDLAAAVSTYHLCSSVLERELGISPSEDTTQRIEQLIAQRGAGGRARLPGSPRAARRTSEAAGLVGRHPELARLRSVWEESAGRARLVLVAGDAGVGKSRLVHDFAGSVRRSPSVVATARCFGSSGRIPFAPLADWLRSPALQSLQADLDPVWRKEVERLVPARSTPGTGEAGRRAMVDAWQRLRFFEGLCRAVLAGARPTLLVLDDLHWCDGETLAWLGYLLGHGGELPLMVLATARPHEIAHNPDVAGPLHSLASAGDVETITLDPLTEPETADLAAQVLGHPLAGREAELLWTTTGGHPLFVIETARILAREPGSATSSSLEAILSRRLEQTSPVAVEVAELAAAVGRDFSLDLLTEASDLEPDTVVRGVDELWQRRILREFGRGYDFTHDLLRDAAYARVTPAQRWLLHRRLAQGLELVYADRLDDVSSQLAEQYDRGGRSDRALPYYARAADAAAAVFAHGEAIRLLRRALGLVAVLPPGPDRDAKELSLLQTISAPLNAVHGYSATEVDVTFQRASELCERLGRQDELLATLVGLFACRFVQGRTRESHEIATRALRIAEDVPEMAGQAHFAFAGSAASLGMPATAVDHFRIAVDLSPGRMGLIVGTRPEVHSLAWSAHSHWMLGHDDEARSASVEAVRLGRESEHPYTLAVSLAYAALTRQLLGEPAEMLAATSELTNLCGRFGFAYYPEWAKVLDGWARGGDDGLAHIGAGIDRLLTAGSLARMPYWLTLQAEAQLAAGLTTPALASLDSAQAAARQHDDVWWLPEVLRIRARLRPRQGTARLLEEARALALSMSSPALAARCQRDLTDITGVLPRSC
ncbi:MAG: ATP-binding protein [Nocardioidaceae bacterium]